MANETTVCAILHLMAGRLRLGDVLDRAQSLLTQQATLTAAQQELSQDLEATIEDIPFLTTILRKRARQHFGKPSEKLSEKLAEFGLQPFRVRQAGSKPIPPPGPIPASTHR
jgi:multidrug efflux pump subunit AcrA (membrane-fusion protein)